MKKLLLRIIGVCMLFAASCVPIMARYLFVAGPEWLRGEGSDPAIILSAICVFAIHAIGGIITLAMAENMKSEPILPNINSSFAIAMLTCAVMLSIGLGLGIWLPILIGARP